MNPFRQK